jgi:hypothetical protein
MSQFLLPCSCGAKIPISRSQAGMTLPCPQCGESVEVPTIRHLNSLEPAASSSPIARKHASRGPSLALRIVAGVLLLLSIGFLGYGGMMAYDRWTFPVDLKMTEEEYIQDMTIGMDELSPASTWDTWNNLADNGLMNLETPTYFRYKRSFEAAAPKMYTYLAIGFASFLGFVVSIFLSKVR